MDLGKAAHYRDQNVCFDVDFIAKRTESAQKGLEILLADRP